MSEDGRKRFWFRKEGYYRPTADTFSVPDDPPRWVVREGDLVAGERVQLIRKGTLVRCLGFVPPGEGNEAVEARVGEESPGDVVYAFFEDCESRDVYRYQLSLRPLWPWEDVGVNPSQDELSQTSGE